MLAETVGASTRAPIFRWSRSMSSDARRKNVLVRGSRISGAGAWPTAGAGSPVQKLSGGPVTLGVGESATAR